MFSLTTSRLMALIQVVLAPESLSSLSLWSCDINLNTESLSFWFLCFLTSLPSKIFSLYCKQCKSPKTSFWNYVLQTYSLISISFFPLYSARFSYSTYSSNPWGPETTIILIHHLIYFFSQLCSIHSLSLIHSLAEPHWPLTYATLEANKLISDYISATPKQPKECKASWKIGLILNL